MNSTALEAASERVARRFTSPMNASTSPLGVATDVSLATALCAVPLVAGVRRALAHGAIDGPARAWFGLAALPLLVLVAVGAWLRLRGRAGVVSWLAAQPFPVENVNGLLAGVGDSFEVVFAPHGAGAPGRAELQPLLDQVSDDALVLHWPDPPPEGASGAGERDEAARTVVIGLGVLPSKHVPFRTSYLRYRRFCELIERVFVPLHAKRPVESVRVR
jgi:hypothetical protein